MSPPLCAEQGSSVVPSTEIDGGRYLAGNTSLYFRTSLNSGEKPTQSDSWADATSEGGEAKANAPESRMTDVAVTGDQLASQVSPDSVVGIWEESKMCMLSDWTTALRRYQA
jgi:hypothetical protein